MNTLIGSLAIFARLRHVFRNAFRKSPGEATAGLTRRAIPGFPLYWRRLAERVLRPLDVPRKSGSIRSTVSLETRTLVVQAQLPIRPAVEPIVERLWPFHYRNVFQTLLYPVLKGTTQPQAKSSPLPDQPPVGGTSTDQAKPFPQEAVNLRWQRLAAMAFPAEVAATGRPESWAGRVVPAPAIRLPTMTHFRAAARRERVRGSAAEADPIKPEVARSIQARHFASATVEATEADSPVFGQIVRRRPARRLEAVVSPEPQVLSAAVPIPLAWRRGETQQENRAPIATAEPKQPMVSPDVPVATAAAPGWSQPGAAQTLLPRPPEATIKDLLTGPTLDRLADDVMRRIDKRLRIERERRGL